MNNQQGKQTNLKLVTVKKLEKQAECKFKWISLPKNRWKIK